MTSYQQHTRLPKELDAATAVIISPVSWLYQDMFMPSLDYPKAQPALRCNVGFRLEKEAIAL